MLLPDAYVKNISNVGDKNGQKRNQHTIVVTNTFCHQHPSPTSMLSFDDHELLPVVLVALPVI